MLIVMYFKKKRRNISRLYKPIKKLKRNLFCENLNYSFFS